MQADERLIGMIYDGVRDGAAWTFVLTQVTERVRAIGAGLGMQDMKTHRFRSFGQVGIDVGLGPTYQRLAPGNRIWQAIAARRQAVADHMVVAKSDFVRTELYADWFAPQRFHSVMAAPTLFEKDACAVIVAFRDARRGDFAAADLAAADRFAGHFGGALDVMAPPVPPDRSPGVDGEPRAGAVEVEHVGADRMLAAKCRHSRRSRPEPTHTMGSGGERLRRSLRAAAMVPGGALMAFRVTPSAALAPPPPRS